MQRHSQHPPLHMESEKGPSEEAHGCPACAVLHAMCRSQLRGELWHARPCGASCMQGVRRHGKAPMRERWRGQQPIRANVVARKVRVRRHMIDDGSLVHTV